MLRSSGSMHVGQVLLWVGPPALSGRAPQRAQWSGAYHGHLSGSPVVRWWEDPMTSGVVSVPGLLWPLTAVVRVLRGG